MQMYRNVVVLLDGSELAEGVLPHVVEVIRDRGSHIHLLSVAPSAKVTPSTIAEVLPPPSSIQEQRHSVDPELDVYLWTIARRLESIAAEVQVNVRSGRPADEILAFVSEVGADLVAMSTHGRSGISRWVFGNVADRVLRGATCPVLLVRAGQAPLRAPYRRILVPLDGSQVAEQVVPYVRALIGPLKALSPERGDTRVFLISVLTAGLTDRTVALLTSYPPGLQLATSALDHAEIQLQSYLRSVAAVLREHGALVQIAVQRGSPADEILAYAAQVEADLISMTTHGSTGASRWAYGNVAGRVLQGAYSPVLLVHPTFTQDGGDRV
jgi:nucleotide-binding universal stress UspA family protein